MFEKRPPCPGNPEDFIWVVTREGGHWRRKRGTKRRAVLNAAFEKNAQLTRVTNAVASEIMNKIRDQLRGLETGRSFVRLAGKLKQAYNRKGFIDFSLLEDFDFQPRHPFKKLMVTKPGIEMHGRTLIVQLDAGDGSVRRQSVLVTHFFFDLILLHGQPGAGQLRVESISSEVFEVDGIAKKTCLLETQVPDHPWMVMLKVSCIEGNTIAASPRNYAMRVLKTGGDLRFEI